MRAPCRVCRRSCAVTRRGRSWWHAARGVVGPLRDYGTLSPLPCPGAGERPLGQPGPTIAPLPGQVLDRDPLIAEHPGGTVYLLCFDAPFGHARHYSGYAGPGNLAPRMAHHRAGSGANLLRHVAAAGIEWQLVRTWAGTRSDERRVKRRGGASRLCPRCTPTVGAVLLARLAG